MTGSWLNAILGYRQTDRGENDMKISVRNWTAIIAVSFAVAAAICQGPAFGQSQADFERLVRSALENAPLVERIESLALSDSPFNHEGDGIAASSELPAKIVELIVVFSPGDTISSTKRGIERAMMAGYHAIFTQDFPVARGEIEARMMLIDPFGNEILGLVYGTALTAEAAKRMNWDNRHTIDPHTVWDAYFMNRAFQE